MGRVQHRPLLLLEVQFNRSRRTHVNLIDLFSDTFEAPSHASSPWVKASGTVSLDTSAVSLRAAGDEVSICSGRSSAVGCAHSLDQVPYTNIWETVILVRSSQPAPQSAPTFQVRSFLQCFLLFSCEDSASPLRSSRLISRAWARGAVLGAARPGGRWTRSEVTESG